MIRKFKSFFNKQDFDYSKEIIDPYEFNVLFFWFSKAFLIIDNEPLERKFIIIHSLFIITLIFAYFLVIICAYNAYLTSDIMIWTQVIAYFILFSYTLMILISQRTNLRYYQTLHKAIRDDYHYICAEGQRYKERFFKSQLETWKLCVACLFFTASGILLALFSLLMLVYYLATCNPDDENDPGRPLLFPIWFFEIKVTETPAYELFFSYTTWTILVIGYVYNFMTQTEIVWIKEVTARADLIIYAIEDLSEDMRVTNDPLIRKQLDESIKNKLSKIVKRSQDMYSLLENFAEVYRKMLLFEQKLGGPVLCMCAYVSSELYLSSGEVNPVLLILFVATFNVCIIPSYMCTFLGEKVRSISDACWNTLFWNASPVIRPYMVLLMQMSLCPLPLQAPGFDDVSLQTFASKISSAYSMFNMLRQTDIGSMQ